MAYGARLFVRRRPTVASGFHGERFGSRQQIRSSQFQLISVDRTGRLSKLQASDQIAGKAV